MNARGKARQKARGYDRLVKSRGPLSRHGTAEGGRVPARPARRMPGLSSHRAPGCMSEFAAGEPAGPAEPPVQPTEQPVLASELSVQPTELPAQPSELRTRAAELRRLFTTFGYLVGKQGATAVLGLAYLAVATHLFSARDVGLAAAASSTAFFLGAVGALGIPLLLVAELDSLPAAVRRVTFSTGMYISCLAVLILSLGTLVLSPFLGNSLRIIGADWTTAALFVIGSVATMGSLTFDDAAIGLHRGSAQLWRGSLTSGLKLVIVGVLVLIGTRTAPGLLFAWALTLVVSFVCFPMLRLEPIPAGEGNLSHRVALARRYGVLSLKHHVLNLSINSVFYIVGVIAALLILPRQLAYFSTAFLVESTAMVIPYLLALSLFAEISGDQSLLHRHVRRTLPLGLALCGGIVVIAEVAAPLAMRIFGPAYVTNGTIALRLLVLVGPAYVIKDHYVAIRRAQGRLGQAAKVMAAGTSAEAAGAALGGIYWGMAGLCAGWAITASLEGVVLLPAVIRVFRKDSPVEPDPGGSSG
jgi:O-antigen/teichoic acid export membrane protein